MISQVTQGLNSPLHLTALTLSPPISRSGTPPVQASPDFYPQPLSTYSELRRNLSERHAPETTLARSVKTPRTEISELASTETTASAMAPPDLPAYPPAEVHFAQYASADQTVGSMNLGPEWGEGVAFTGTEYFDFLDPFFQL